MATPKIQTAAESCMGAGISWAGIKILLDAHVPLYLRTIPTVRVGKRRALGYNLNT